MVVAIIIAILLLIAVPIYQDYEQRSRRTDAMNSLLKLQAEQEKYRTTCINYAKQLVGTRTCNAGTTTFILGHENNSSQDGYYTLAILNGADAVSYTMTATPQVGGLQDGDACGTFAINQDGPLHTGYANEQCWRR